MSSLASTKFLPFSKNNFCEKSFTSKPPGNGTFDSLAKGTNACSNACCIYKSSSAVAQHHIGLMRPSKSAPMHTCVKAVVTSYPFLLATTIKCSMCAIKYVKCYFGKRAFMGAPFCMSSQPMHLSSSNACARIISPGPPKNAVNSAFEIYSTSKG